MRSIATFLMFEGRAEEAMKFYTSAVPNSEILSITRYGKNESGVEGTVKLAAFTLNGQEFMAIDSSAHHAFSFTPAMSLYLVCETDAEIDTLYEKLSTEGQVLMPLDRYDFSEKFGWVADRFGVSWQLRLN